MFGVDTTELRTTVGRLELRLRDSEVQRIVELMSIYDQLIPLFQSDLKNERDELLSRVEP